MPDDADFWAFLDWTDPIDSPEALAFQVSQLTLGMAALKRELDRLKE